MVNSSDYRTSDDRQSSEKLERHEMRWLWPSLNYYPIKCLEKSQKSMNSSIRIAHLQVIFSAHDLPDSNENTNLPNFGSGC
jgi:hypothetical protein